MLAAKTVLAIRYDAFGEDSSSAMGVENRAKLEARLRILEDRGVRTTPYLQQMLAFQKLINYTLMNTKSPGNIASPPPCFLVCLIVLFSAIDLTLH